MKEAFTLFVFIVACSSALHRAQNPPPRPSPSGRTTGTSPEQLRDALAACVELNPVYRRLLRMFLDELQVLEKHIDQLDCEMAGLLRSHGNAVQRLAQVPGLGVDSAQQIIAEVGSTAGTFESAKHLCSWVGACPGEEESAGRSKSHPSPKGNRQMRQSLRACELQAWNGLLPPLD